LPQLAATGIEGRVIQHKAGWKVIWGPVHANAIPAFVRNGLTKTREMGAVGFPWPERVEMAIAWAFPISIFALLLFPFWSRSFVRKSTIGCSSITARPARHPGYGFP